MNELGNTPADKNYKPSGISKAESRALEFYPMKDFNKEPNYLHTCDSKMLDEIYRQVFMIGYEQAEKDLTDVAMFSSGPDGFYYGRGYQQGMKDAKQDLALTWEDIRKIVVLFSEVSFECFDTKSANEMCEETLTRFKQYKEEQK